MSEQAEHRLVEVLRGAARGRFPPVDGVAELLPPDAAGTCAVVSFTGHAFVLTDLAPSAFAGVVLDGFGAATDPRALVRLGAGREVGSLDVVLVRAGDGAPGVATLARRDDLEQHPRVRRARHHRRDVRVLGDARGFVTIGHGLVGRTELSVEVTGGDHGRGAGRALIAEGLRSVPSDELVFAQVAPGNAASLRAFLACGFVPIGSEVLIVSSDGTR